MSDCGCNSITTTPCTASTGCISTNYAKCILYSGATLTNCVPLTSGENLDVSLGKIVNAICALTPANLSWNLFNYSCLTAYTTAQGFAEGISAAHCALVTRVVELEAPVFTLCSLFQASPYTITPGTTSLETILQYYGAAICALQANNPSVITLSNNCFPELTTQSTLQAYLQWIVNGVCTIRTAILTIVSGHTSQLTAIQNYIGPVSTVASRHDNSDCLGGGVTDTVYDTIQLLKTKLCVINSTVAALPDLANMSLSWAPCFYSNATTTLSTQLGRMVSRLKLQNFQFDAGDFTVTANACGPIISLNAALAFNCSDLGSCSIHSLGDVINTDDSGSDTGGNLTYDHALGYYRPIRQLITLAYGGRAQAAGAGTISITTTTPVNTADLSRAFTIVVEEQQWLDLTPYAGTYITPGTGVNTPMLMKTWDGMLKFKGEFYSGPGAASLYILGGSGQPLNNDSGIQLFASIPLAYRPTTTAAIPILVKYHNNVGTNPNAFNLMGDFLFSSATGHIRLYTRDSGALAANIDGAPGTDNYLGNYYASLWGAVINY